MVSQTEEERRNLIAKAQTGCITSRNQIAESNDRLIFRAMKPIRRKDNSLEEGDLYTYGYFGLLEAIDKFDLSRGFRFSTYAVKCCFRHMIRGLQNEGRLIRLPVHVIEELGEINATDGTRLVETGEHMTEEEIAVELDYSEDKVRLYVGSNQSILSLDVTVASRKGDGDESTLAELLPGGRDDYHTLFLRSLIEEALESLDERTRFIIHLKDYEDKTLQEISIEESIQVSRERVRGIRKEGLAAMKLFITRKLGLDAEAAYRELIA